MEEVLRWLTENVQWVITTIFSAIAAIATVWRWVVKPGLRNRENKRRTLLRDLENEKISFVWLRGFVDGRLSILKNEYYFQAEQMRIEFPTELAIPSEWCEDVELNYNKEINELSNLMTGARNFTRNAVARNVTKHLTEVNEYPKRASDRKSLWVIGHNESARLDEVMVMALEEPIMRGYRVDKVLFEGMDPYFCSALDQAILQKKSGDFKAFLEDLNRELENDRSNGILLGVSKKRKEIIEYMTKLQDRITKRIGKIEEYVEKKKRKQDSIRP
jgi:hypothetical protein